MTCVTSWHHIMTGVTSWPVWHHDLCKCVGHTHCRRTHFRLQQPDLIFPPELTSSWTEIFKHTHNQLPHHVVTSLCWAGCLVSLGQVGIWSQDTEPQCCGSAVPTRHSCNGHKNKPPQFECQKKRPNITEASCAAVDLSYNCWYDDMTTWLTPGGGAVKPLEPDLRG